MAKNPNYRHSGEFNKARLTSFANAKINLFLNVVGKRADGYHLLESLFIPVKGLQDTITVEDYDSLECIIKGYNIKDNIVLKVAEKLASTFGVVKGARITIKKKIPISAGLGGGSSDAATVLKLLCKLWEIEMTTIEMAAFSQQIGADVPFFVYNTPAIVRGIGEDIAPITLNKELHLLLINPKVEVRTEDVFMRGFQSFSHSDRDLLSQGHLEKLIYNGKNDLQENAIKLCSEINVVLNFINRQDGCLVSRLSGSGATCFGIFKDRESAMSAQGNINKDWWCHTETVKI